MSHRRSKGSWEIRLDLGRNPVTGKRVRRAVTVRGTRRDAERREAALRHQLATGTYVDPSRLTVADFMEKWLSDYATVSTAPRTAERYTEIVRTHIAPAIGAVRLQDLRPAHKLEVERKWREGTQGRRPLSPATVLKHHRILREALHHAVRWQFLAVNPVDAVAPPRAERREMSVLNVEQANRFMHIVKNAEYETVLTTAVLTGLRIGELLGLRWRDVDLAAGCLHVQQTLQSAGAGHVTFRPTKTHRSRRNVALPSAATEALRRHRAEQNEQRLRTGAAWNDHDLVFAGPLGRPISLNSLRWQFHRMLSDAELPRLRLHDLRHTMATLMLAQGEHPRW